MLRLSLKTSISQPANKISKIWLLTFPALVQFVYVQNFSPLASKLGEEFEVTDRQMDIFPRYAIQSTFSSSSTHFAQRGSREKAMIIVRLRFVFFHISLVQQQ